MALRKSLAVICFLSGFGLQLHADVAPNTEGIVTGGDQAAVRQSSPVVSRPEDHPKYLQLVQELTVDFDMSSVPSEGAKNAFEAYVKQPRNSGITVGFLRNYDVKALRAFKARILEDGFIRGAFQENARATVTRLKELVEEKVRRVNRDIQRQQERLEDSARALRAQLADPSRASQKERLEGLLREITIEMDAIKLANERYTRLSLDEIANKQGNWFFGAGDDGRYAQVMGWMERLLPEMAGNDDFKPSSGKPNLITDLLARIKYIQDFAKAAHSGNKGQAEGNKYAVAYILSWFLTGLSQSEINAMGGGQASGDTHAGAVDQAIEAIGAAGTPGVTAPAEVNPVPGTGSGTDSNAGAGQTTGTNIPSLEQLTNEQKLVYNSLMASFREDVTFTSGDKTIRGQRVAYIVNEIKLIERTVALHNTYLDTANPDSLISAVSQYWTVISTSNHPKLPEARRLKEKFDQAAEGARAARQHRDRVFSSLQTAMNAANLGIKAEDLVSAEKMLEFSRAAAAANMPESQRRNLTLLMTQYAEGSLRWLHALSLMEQAQKELTPVLEEIVADLVSGPSAQLQAVLDWIARYNRHREANLSTISDIIKQENGAIGQEIKVARNYTEAVKNLLEIVETSFADQKILFDASVMDDPGMPTFQQCSALFKDFSLATVKFPATGLSQAVSAITSPVDTVQEMRVVCMANYEANLKAGNPTHELFKRHDGVSPDSFGFKVRGVVDAMGSRRSSVAVSATAEHSLHEGLYENLYFMRGLTNWLIAWIKEQLQKEGVSASEVARGDVRSGSAHAVALRIGDAILFAHNVSDLSTSGRATLEKIKKAFRPILDNNDIKTLIKEIVVEGHASASGTRAHNQGLSERRAESVLTVIREMGAIGFVSKGYGENKPINSRGEAVAYNVNGPDLQTVPGADAAKSRRVELSFSLNMVEIENILKEKGERFHRLRNLFRGVPLQESVPAAPVETVSVDADVVTSEPVEVPAETNPAVTGAKAKVAEWQTYLSTGRNASSNNDLYYNPSWIYMNRVLLRPAFATELIQMHNIIIIHNKPKADEMWSIIGKYFKDINGKSGAEVARPSADKDFVPNEVIYTRGTGGGPAWINPALTDFPRLFALIQSL
ncbi:MAG: OmpA family protein [Candidatus Cloacimonetes bacterium]|nr:OmpA family protein [Candidatus Cloacimonadota bacterium]